MRTIDKILSKVNCKFGSPIGRFSNTPDQRPKNKTIFDSAVKLIDSGYDKGGAYWGLPNNLRVEYTKDLSYVRFYREGENEPSPKRKKQYQPGSIGGF